MRFGLGRLRLPPSHFWSLTPRELAAAASAHAPLVSPPLNRAGFAALAALFPDRQEIRDDRHDRSR